MKQISEMLAGHDAAQLYPFDLMREHEVWLVGGAARIMLSDSNLTPSDFDLLVNTGARNGVEIHSKLQPPAGAIAKTNKSGDSDGNFTFDGVGFDVFEKDIHTWMNQTPCFGDQLAIRLKDYFTLVTPKFFTCSPWMENPRDAGKGEAREAYMLKHKASLQRDSFLFQIIRNKNAYSNDLAV